MRMLRSLLVVTILLIALPATLSGVTVRAQSSQSTYTLSLTYFSVAVTFPSEVHPGDLVTVSMQATAKSSLSSATVTAEILYPKGNSINQLTTATVSSNGYVNSGSTLSKQIQFTVPPDAPRTSLLTIVEEQVQTSNSYNSYGYYNSPVYYDNSNPDCYYSADWSSYYYGYCNYYGSYYGYPYAYPSYSTSSSTDNGVAPLSYIKAQTPEYSALQSQYQTAKQQLNQSQAQNQQLQQQLSQSNATVSTLNQQLSANQSSNTTLDVVAVGLAVLAIIFGAFALHYRNKSTPRPQPSGSATASETRKEG